jgi:hypothetical protein
MIYPPLKRSSQPQAIYTSGIRKPQPHDTDPNTAQQQMREDAYSQQPDTDDQCRVDYPDLIGRKRKWQRPKKSVD